MAPRHPRNAAPPKRPGGLPALGELESIVGPAHVLTDPELTAPFERDWTGRFGGPASAVVRPATTDETAAVLRWCFERSVAVVPQGGNTGLVGGSVPRPAPAQGAAPPVVVLSLRRLDRLERLDEDSLLLVAGAGMTLAAAEEVAGRIGCEVGVDLAARGSATLGGMLATNAGGMRVMRHGTMRALTVGVEAVLADGSLVGHLDGLWKDNVGPDLVSLLAGSEGTLAVVTAVALRLVPAPAERRTALVGLRSPDDLGAATAVAVAASAALRRQVTELEALELTFRPGMALVMDRFGLASPPGWDDGAACWLTIEAGGDVDPTERLAAALEALDEVVDAAVATDRAGRERLWRYREAHADAVASLGTPHKLDVSVPPRSLAAFAGALPGCVDGVAPGARLICFGHVADGNLHVNVVGPDPDDEAVDDAVLRLALDLAGSISAEHGIGVAKTAYLPLARSAAELALAAKVKAALDPKGILNPGVLAPPD